ncbi:DUF4011 domain-containing protein [Natronorubrum tibetense]|uniref:Type III restriction protein res subunit n=1 Tax=Natronorubrum tibetense GA33 TaxID=1114856 RepID=L9VGW5_9EURY|nr:DUF4011 domain-containing protein [Natronorubrum tibetense]ELY35558.1 type III restriction protein res subunit [Natronorubrum tibetense GA33]
MTAEEACDAAVDAVVDGWQEQLLDLTRRNTLVDFEPTKTKSIPLAAAAGPVVDRLRETGAIELAKAPDESPPETARTDPTTVSDSAGTDAAVALRAPEAAEESLDAIERYHRQYLRERGADTLFLSIGRLTWTESGDTEPYESPLFLLSVELEHRPETAEDVHAHVVAYDGAPLVVNPALRRKLQIERDLDLPADGDIAVDDLDAAFDAIAAIADSFHDWGISRELAVCIFDFATVSLYEDLDRNREAITSDPLVRAIAGDTDALNGHTDDREINEETTADGTTREGTSTDETERDANQLAYQVLEADPSQRAAIDAALDGESFVLQGPPGTGKSQTISNIVAAKLGRDERVLFVSEKQAALDVVQSRLAEVGLGRFCLEAHGQQATKSNVLDALGRELRSGRADLPAGRDACREHRDDAAAILDDHAERLTTPPDGFAVTPYEALGIVAAGRNEPRVDVNVDAPLAVGQNAVDDAITALREVAAFDDVLENFATHPWRAATVDGWRVDTRERVADAIEDQLSAVDAMCDLADRLASTVSVELRDATSFEDVERALVTLTDAPVNLLPAAFLDAAFYAPDGPVATLAAAHVERADHESHLRERYASSIFDEDGRELHETLCAYGRLRYVRPSYRRLKRRLTTHAREGYTPDLAALREDARRLRALQSLEDTIAEVDVDPRYLVPFVDGTDVDPEPTQDGIDGARLQENIDWQRVQGVSDWVRALADTDVVDPATASGGLDANAFDTIDEFHEALATHRERFQAARDDLASFVALDELDADGTAFPAASWSAQRTVLETLRENLDRLQDWVAFQAARNRVADTIAGDYLDEFLAAGHDSSHLVSAFERGFYRHWLNALYDETDLDTFNAETYTHHLETYREADDALREHDAAAVRHAVTSRRPSIELEHADSAAQVVLKRELGKAHHQRPLRELFADAGEIIQQLKPCFMMSPRTVADSLALDAIEFDTVIFDEASQIPPAKAVSALVRADQVIVAGDANQLPPTSFFETDLADDTGGRTDLESILDEAAAVIPEQYLTWHYRSAAPSLVSFSNDRYYDGRLRTFPAPATDDTTTGLEFEYVPDGVYDRGDTRQNEREAERVVDIVASHAEMRPDETLGVVAFSRAQERAIRDALADRRRENPTLDAFVDCEDVQEGFFVKTLEVVQGDERDRIVFSVGYGPTESGTVTANFGPLNRSGGHRRLNVAITRARRQVTVVSSLHPEDVDASGATHRGVADFKRYLAHVRDHDPTAASPTASDGDPPITSEVDADSVPTTAGRASPTDDTLDSPLARDVYKTLSDAGFDVATDLGTAGYVLDMAIRDPEDPHQYALGIELDGAAARHAASTRDRERLRQLVLADRGWDVHRIWAPTWATDPERERDRIRERVNGNGDPEPAVDATTLVHPPSDRECTATDPAAEEADSHPVQSDGGDPFDTYEPPTVPDLNGDDFGVPPREVQRALLSIVADAGPVTETTAYRTVAEALEADRLDTDLRERLADQAQAIADAGHLHIHDAFLWPPRDAAEIPLRGHADDRRKVTAIPRAELAKASYVLLANGGAMTRTDLVLETTRRFGYDRVGSRIEERLEEAVDHLIEIEAVIDDGDRIEANLNIDIDAALESVVYQ